MPVIQGQEWTFNTVAETYEKIRPGYPDELYRAIFAYCPVDASSHAVEVGIGGGQATLPVLKTGCTVTAVEYGDLFAQLCREKFRSYPEFSVVTGKFEQVGFPDESCDLVYSASAFHWIPEEIGYPKVFRMLKTGGAFARFANHPFRAKDNPDLFREISEVYAKYYYTYYKDQNSLKSIRNTQRNRQPTGQRPRKNTVSLMFGMPCITEHVHCRPVNTGR